MNCAGAFINTGFIMINLKLHETTALSSLPSSAPMLETKTGEGSATPEIAALLMPACYEVDVE